MKELKDYLHLYLGCEVTRWHQGTEVRSILTSTNLSGFQIESKRIKLILRPLSDMTEDEGKEIIQQIHNSIYGYDCQFASIAKYSEIGVGFVAYDADKNRISVTIDMDRGVEFYYNGNEFIVRQFEITKYLLSKSFDLFGLIESGLAIDSTTLKTAKP